MTRTAFDEAQAAYWNETTNLRPYDHPVVAAFAHQRVAVIQRLLAAESITSALEIGCGDGFGMHYMAPLVDQLCGSDISHVMLRHNPRPNHHLAQGDAYHTPYPDNAFDLVYCWELLHHIDDPLAVVSEMGRISRRYVLIFEPNCFNPAQALFGWLVPAERGTLRFHPWYLLGLARAAGLEVVDAFSGGCFPPNRTPQLLAGYLSRLPYHWPLIGISNVLLAEVR